MVSVPRIIPASGLRVPPVHYHTLLTSVLQLRFGQLCKLVLFASWLISIIVGYRANYGWIWWLLPIRSFWFFLVAFPILILRKRYVHIDSLPYASLFAELKGRIVSIGFLAHWVFYVFSSSLFFWLYSEQMTDVSVKKIIKVYEPPVINERALYLFFFSIFTASVYTLFHIVFDLDKLHFPSYSMNIPPRIRIEQRLSSILYKALFGSALVSLFSPFLYLALRNRIWNSSIEFFRLFFLLHRSNAYYKFPVGLGMLADTLFSSFLLFLVWEFSNEAFSIYMSLGPLHRNCCISEKSKDKNGTLVTGIRAVKRPLTRALAFQELLYISLNQPNRRTEIYKDINREIPIWGQILKECSFVLNQVVKSTTKKFDKESSQPLEKPLTKTSATPVTVIPIKNENIFLKGRPTHSIMEGFQDNNASISKDMVNSLKNTLDNSRVFLKQYSSYRDWFFASRMGIPFRQTIQRRVKIMFPNPVLTMNAITALSSFMVHSIDEDVYGTVQRDIPVVLHELCMTMSALEGFLNSPHIHWSDIDAQRSSQLPNLEEINVIMDAVYTGFIEIVDKFGAYFEHMDLSREVQNKVRELYTM
ncbi:hypothetical protein NADFUDRAFT_81016 [Nadsonia fulvescens var. elongata DSM 6958]|uniref:Nucleoporin NDC1 n=1 Tax=Nadsonia fulvescens var. elongata DSM 6958 TaxID=857566 RepID=A0A1E3PRK2_9ASCO|nr:hypothetical protein NADFUDRAFT_81016 [Nadsonia fulvescens var. elongata DSM 6958]